MMLPLSSRRQLMASCLATTLYFGGPPTSCQAFSMKTVGTAITRGSLRHHAFGTSQTLRPFTATAATTLHMAAPGVVLSSTADIQAALTNPETVVVDARRVDEITANGYWETDRQWVHAPCTPDGDCPLLDTAAPALLRNPTAPVIVYCASGKRASVAQQLLQSRGYTTVLNAGGYPGDFGELL